MSLFFLIVSGIGGGGGCGGGAFVGDPVFLSSCNSLLFNESLSSTFDSIWSYTGIYLGRGPTCQCHAKKMHSHFNNLCCIYEGHT